MPHFLARLLLTALTTSLATSVAMSVATTGAISAAHAAEPRPMTYVFEGLDGPDLATAPGLATMRVDPVQLAAPSLAPVQTISLSAVLMHPAATALPQGPLPDGTALVAAFANSLKPDMNAAAPEPGLVSADGPADPVSGAAATELVDACGELLPLDPAQPPVAAIAALSPAGAGLPQTRSAMLSLLDGPGPLPALRSVASMVSGAAASSHASLARASPSGPANNTPSGLASAAAAASGGDPPVGETAAAPDPDGDPAPEPAPGDPKEAESLRDAIIASLKGNPEFQIALAQQDDAK